MRFLKIFGVFVLLFAGLLAIAEFYFADKYKSYVQQAVVSKLNENLAAEVKVESINLSFWSSFPYASLDFENVLIKEARAFSSTPDTLIFASQFKLLFNVWDLYNEEYRIIKANISQGNAQFLVDKNGQLNYVFWKTSSDTSNANVSLDLNEIILEEVSFSYTDERQKDFISTFISSASAKGNFSAETFELNVDGKFLNSKIDLQKTTYLPTSDLNCSVKLNVNTSESTYTISQGNLTINNLLNFAISGNINKSNYQFNVNGNQLDLSSTLALLPKAWTNQMGDWSATGLVNFKGEIKGDASQNNLPYIGARFDMNKGTFQFSNRPEKMRNLKFSGAFKTGSNGSLRSANLTIDSLSASLKNGVLATAFSIQNMVAPTIEGELLAKLSLQDWKEVIPVDTFEVFEGNVEAAIRFKTQLPKWEFTKNDLKNLSTSGSMKVEGLKIKLENNPTQITANSGQVDFFRDQLKLSEVQGQFGTIDYLLNGSLKNLFGYLFFEERLLLKASLAAPYLDANQFVSKASDGAAPEPFTLPDRLIAKFDAVVDSFIFRNFTATDLSGSFTLAPYQLKTEEITFKGLGGQGIGQFSLIPNPDKGFVFTSTSSFEQITVNDLFYAFENFGQELIRDDHLKGKANADIEVKGLLNPYFEVDYPSIKSHISLSIQNGELIAFEPFDELTAYFKEQAVLKRLINTEEFERRVKHIKFEELNNEITVDNGLITIPEINVRSTVMNVELSGTHSFENKFDYDLSFDLKELMMKDEKTTEFGAIEDDGLGGKIIYLTLVGNPDDFDINLNKEKRKEAKKETLQQKKNEVKQILKEEFSGESETPDLQEKEFEVEWEEFDQPADSAKTDSALVEKEKDTKPSKLKKFFDKVLENPEADKKKQPQVEFEDDF